MNTPDNELSVLQKLSVFQKMAYLIIDLPKGLGGI